MSQHTKPISANASRTVGVAVDGTRFAYREFGPTTGVPVVFLHHFTAVIDDWDPRVIDGIASERRVMSQNPQPTTELIPEPPKNEGQSK